MILLRVAYRFWFYRLFRPRVVCEPAFQPAASGARRAGDNANFHQDLLVALQDDGAASGRVDSQHAGWRVALVVESRQQVRRVESWALAQTTNSAQHRQ